MTYMLAFSFLNILAEPGKLTHLVKAMLVQGSHTCCPTRAETTLEGNNRQNTGGDEASKVIDSYQSFQSD